jgi:hypothetical protein
MQAMKKFLQKLTGANKKPRKSRRKKNIFTVRKWDPLFIIFEKHLYDFNYESRELFIQGVVEEYFSHLSEQKVIVPAIWRKQMESSISEEVSAMLVRKIYGCLTVEEFKQKEDQSPAQISDKKEARKRYQKLVG